MFCRSRLYEDAGRIRQVPAEDVEDLAFIQCAVPNHDLVHGAVEKGTCVIGTDIEIETWIIDGAADGGRAPQFTVDKDLDLVAVEGAGEVIPAVGLQRDPDAGRNVLAVAFDQQVHPAGGDALKDEDAVALFEHPVGAAGGKRDVRVEPGRDGEAVDELRSDGGRVRHDEIVRTVELECSTAERTIDPIGIVTRKIGECAVVGPDGIGRGQAGGFVQLPVGLQPVQVGLGRGLDQEHRPQEQSGYGAQTHSPGRPVVTEARLR